MLGVGVGVGFRLGLGLGLGSESHPLDACVAQLAMDAHRLALYLPSISPLSPLDLPCISLCLLNFLLEPTPATLRPYATLAAQP